MQDLNKKLNIYIIFYGEKGISIFKGELCEARNGTKHCLMVHEVVAVLFTQDAPHLEPPVAGFMPEADPGLQFLSVRVDEGRTFDILGEVASVTLVTFHLFPLLKHVDEVHFEYHVVIELARGKAAIPPNNRACSDANADLVPDAHSLEFVGPEVWVVYHGKTIVCTIYGC